MGEGARGRVPFLESHLHWYDDARLPVVKLIACGIAYLRRPVI